MLNEILLSVNSLKEKNTTCGEINNEYKSFTLYDGSNEPVIEITCYNNEIFRKLKSIIKNNFEIEWEDTMTEDEKDRAINIQSQKLRRIEEIAI
jgi:hypothetical protein